MSQSVGIEHVGGGVERRRVSVAEVEGFRTFVESLATETDEERAERQLSAILTAETAEDIFAVNIVLKAEQVLGHRLRVDTLRTAESDYEEGPDFYLVWDCFDETVGKAITVECGAADVVVKLARATQLGLLPIIMIIRKKDKATKRGFFPLSAELAPPGFD